LGLDLWVSAFGFRPSQLQRRKGSGRVHYSRVHYAEVRLIQRESMRRSRV
jgi:hypothetical protein